MIGQIIDGDDYKALWQWKKWKMKKKKQNETIQLSYLNVVSKSYNYLNNPANQSPNHSFKL